jgi:hypothetical protein
MKLDPLVALAATALVIAGALPATVSTAPLLMAKPAELLATAE